MKLIPACKFVAARARRVVVSARGCGVSLLIAASGAVSFAADVGGFSVFVSESVVPSRLLRANPDNGAVTSVGSTSFVPGLDFNSGGVLYGASSNLYTVSTATGAFQTIGALPELIVSIAFSPNGELFGVSNDGRTLYKVDPLSGRSLASVALSGTVFSGSGNPFVGEINGIDFGPDGKLYGVGVGLYAIDPNTGVAARITPIARGVASNTTIFADLDFGSDGQLRAVTAALGDATSDLYTISPTTGIGQLVGPIGVKAGGIATVIETPSAPAITSQPLNLSVALAGTASFTVTATGMPSPTYQWRKDGADIPGATGASLLVPNVTPSAVGGYNVVVTNPSGSVTSRVATLQINIPGSGRLINLSILTSITGNGETFTVGTVVGGSGTNGTKPLLVRAVGPSLTQLGVGGVLTDPKVDIFSGSLVTAGNDNWGGGNALTSTFTQVGAFALAAPDSRDAAVYIPSMPAGGYTVQVGGVGAATGTVIAELYDGTPTNDFNATTPRLVNVSVLKEISTSGTLTAGFTVGGSASMQVLIRAVGPSLTAFGVGSAMADPQIIVFDVNSRSVAANDNWGGGTILTQAFSSVGAFTFAAGSRDAAVLVFLQPGNYTAQVSGVGGMGGSVLVEVYEVR